MFKLNSKGMGLTEVLMAMGLLGLASVAFMKLQENMTRGQITSEAKMGELEIKRIVSNALLDRTACLQTFQNKNIGQSVTAILNSVGAPLYEVGKKYEGQNIEIQEIRTEDKNMPGPNGTRSVDLIIATGKAKSQAYSNDKLLRIPLYVMATGPTAQITDCFTDGDQLVERAMKESCLSIDGVWDEVSKKCRFETLRVSKNVSGVTQERFNVTATGVGIGTATPTSALDVQGSIKIGSTNAPCQSGIEGSIRYNSSSKKMEVCNGTAWSAMGGGSSEETITVSCKYNAGGGSGCSSGRPEPRCSNTCPQGYRVRDSMDYTTPVITPSSGGICAGSWHNQTQVVTTCVKN